MTPKDIYRLKQLIREELNRKINIPDSLINRIPFFKEYTIVENEPDYLKLQKIKYQSKKIAIKDEVYNFDIFNEVSEFSFSKHKIRDNVFYSFFLKNEFLISQPKGMDDLQFRVLQLMMNKTNEKLSYRKEIILKEGEEISKEELDSIINHINKKLFEFEEASEKA
jgi:hypothetical protein